MKITILYSGGLDSTILYAYAKVNYPNAAISCVWFHHGHSAAIQEEAVLPSFVKVRRMEWLQLSDVVGYTSKSENGQSEASYIPGRNLVFAVLAACQDVPDEIWMGTLENEVHDYSVDRSAKFMEDTSKLLSYVLSPFKPNVKLRAPLAEAGFDKFKEIEWALQNALTQNDIIATWSCYNLNHNVVNQVPCGDCAQCMRRKILFGTLGFEEKYIQDPFLNKYTISWLRELFKQCALEGWAGEATTDLIGWFGTDERYLQFLINSNIDVEISEYASQALKKLVNNNT